MKLSKYKIIQNPNGTLTLLARERALPLLELLITDPHQVPTSMKAICFVPVFGFLILLCMLFLVVYSREFWEIIDRGTNPLDFVAKKAQHEKALREAYIEAKETNTVWSTYMNL